MHGISAKGRQRYTKETYVEGRETERERGDAKLGEGEGDLVRNDYHSSCNAVQKRVVGHPL